MRSKIDILKQIQKNQTYQSIRFNNKQISDQQAKSSIEQFFPKLFSQQKWKDITFFIKAMKDQEFYQKIKTILNLYFSLENHLKQIQNKQNQKNKIQDNNQNKKMTRAALAKRNLETQQELRKDQIYVRLIPKDDNCLYWMLRHRNFPRFQCKLSCNQHLQYLVNHLQNKWLKGKGHYKIVLYPDASRYMKNSNLSVKERQKALKQPLNNYFMFTDLMVVNGVGQNGALNIFYEILQKKNDTRNRAATLINNSVKNISNQKLSIQQIKGIPDIYDRNKNLMKIEQNIKQSINSRSNNSQKYLPISIINPNSPNKLNEFNQHQGQILTLNNNLNISMNHQNNSINNTSNQYLIMNQNNQNSNNFNIGMNQSNILNANKNIYNDQQSIFKSIGFFGLGSFNNNIMGFANNKKNDYNLLSINSNSYLGIQNQNQNNSDNKNKFIIKNQNSSKQGFNTIQIEKKQINQQIQKDKDKDKFKQKSNSKEFSQFKQQNNSQIKKTDKLIDLRNAINFVQVAQGFNNQLTGKQQISQNSVLKQIKTVSIKKKTIN